jgi:hypothetical protein
VKPIKNVAASVHQRLLNVGKQTSRPFNEIVQYYAIERWLYRLAKSDYRERFVLKGALMLLVWKTSVTRPTRDIDFLARASNDLESIRGLIAEVCGLSVENDGMAFDPGSVTTERIAEDADYEGVRASFSALLGNTRLHMQVDIGFSDVITPDPIAITYPTILAQPAPELRAYNRETVIAEKFEVMVSLGEINSRMKDFFDVWLLAESFDFDGSALANAIRETFARRRTRIDIEPICFAHRFAHDPAKSKQWTAFLRRSLLTTAPSAFFEIVERIKLFLQPVATALENGKPFDLRWQRGGPWQP